MRITAKTIVDTMKAGNTRKALQMVPYFKKWSMIETFLCQIENHLDMTDQKHLMFLEAVKERT